MTPQQSTSPSLPRVVLLVDRPASPCQLRARDLAARLASRFAIQIAASADALDASALDLLYVFSGADRRLDRLDLRPERVVLEWDELPIADDATAAAARAATWTTPTRALRARLGTLHPRVFHVPNGVDTRLFFPRRRPGRALRIGWVGNPKDASKGLHDVVRPACDGRFELVASDGRQTQRELARLYNRVDVLAIDSQAESQPLPLMEAMACGCFPVATDVGIVPELVRNGVNGLVVPRTPDAFRDAFAWCAANLAAVRRAGRLNAELAAEERDWDRLATRFGDVLDAALGRAPQPSPEAPAPQGPARAALARGLVPARVAFVTSEFPSENATQGGLARYLARMADALAASGHRAEIFVPSRHEAGRVRWNGAQVERVAVAATRAPVRAALRLLGALGPEWASHALPALVESWSLARALRRRQRELPFDLIQSADHRGVGLFVRALSPALHVIRCSNDDAEIARWNSVPASRRRGLEALTRLALRRARHLYAPSRFLAERLRAATGREVRVLRPPAWLETKPAAAPLRDLPARYFVHAGQLSAAKGTPVLAKALARVLREEPSFHMVWAGVDRFGLVERSRREWPEGGERVRYAGSLEPAELYALLAGAEAAVFPSRVDNLPNAVIESLLLGVPVIGSDGASIDELVEPGVTGVLVPPGDADALADAMLRQWRGETGVRAGFRWQGALRDAMQPERAVAALLELGGL